jgi:uncharacterized membrane protein
MLIACTSRRSTVQPQFINPNFHVILIHYPLALLGVGILIELFAFLWRRSTFRMAGRWMILLGIISLVPAATSGLYALQDVSRTPETLYSNWADVRAASPVQGHAWEMLKDHAWFNAAGTAIFLLVMVLWLGASDAWRGRLHFPLLFILVVAMAILVAGAWNGGEMIYRHGVAVKHESSAEESENTSAKHDITYYVPPMQVHVILAGFAFAVGIAAIGLSLRAGAAVGAEVTPEMADINAALNTGARPVTPTSSIGYVEESPVRVTVVRQPVSRYWLIGALIGLAAAATGWWVLAQELDTVKPNELWAKVVDTSDGSRRLAHSITGVTVVVWMVLMALIARMAAGRKIVISLFSMLLLLAVIAQLWFGGLLLLDTAAGPPLQLNAGGAAPSPTSQPTSAPTPPTTSTASVR